MYQIIFKLPGEKQITLNDILSSQSILDIALDNDVNIESLCGGAGICKKCRFIVQEGQQHLENQPAFQGEDDAMYACQTILAPGEGKLVINLD